MRDLVLKRRQASSTSVRHLAWVALVLTAAALAGCDKLATTNQAIPESGPDPSYPDVVANYLKSTFKDYTSYEAFENIGAALGALMSRVELADLRAFSGSRS